MGCSTFGDTNVTRRSLGGAVSMGSMVQPHEGSSGTMASIDVLWPLSVYSTSGYYSGWSGSDHSSSAHPLGRVSAIRLILERVYCCMIGNLYCE